VIEPLRAANPLNQQPPEEEKGRKRTKITQIHWDFESGVLRNVGKDEALHRFTTGVRYLHARAKEGQLPLA
jgi:hypothetical protein